ncbi:uncharacterized protein LOC116339642 [Contarinia nasturtii]|uniref:uncharacterized protein LOC116339642 n=1 Tax=Contarinia nasturtii TaxID=265458 RepID=UPI0012D40AEE|nr:uncharacterized protein LOC116339642 [Contarinia nasturtii]XP_031621511.1 uncharacterized protein LOC116339642 [Contarinia nasturtii]
MKILWESFSFLSTPFVRLSTRPKKNYHYVISIVAFILLFTPHCIAQDSTTIDKVNDTIVNATHPKWSIVKNADDSGSQSSDARVAISKRQSPTKISNSLSSNRMFSSNYHRATDAPTHDHHEKSHLFTRDASTSSKTNFPPSTPVKLVTMPGIEQPSSASINNVLILIQTHKNIELNLVRDQFHQFTDMFGVKLANITIDFDTIDGISTLIKRLDSLNYSTIYFQLDESYIRNFSVNCDILQQLSSVYHRHIIFWPCVCMKKSERYLPSFQTIAYAIQSASQKFNWSEAIIFADNEYGLPLAIAANLHLPYHIKIGLDNFNNFHNMDAFDRLFIITSSLNSHETLTLLRQLSVYNRSKILIIDIIGNIFNKQNEFYKTINQHKEKWLSGNLLVLTTLTSKLKRFLNATLTTDFNNIYGKMRDESTTGYKQRTTTATAATMADIDVDQRSAINLLEMRLNEYGQRDAYQSNGDDNILVHFNETELNLIASVFEKLHNDICRLRAESVAAEAAIQAKSMSNVAKSSHDVHNKTHFFEKFGNTSRADAVNESLSICAPNNNSLSKCEMVLRERATLFANSTRTMDITKVLCEQIQLWRQKNPPSPPPPPPPTLVSQQQQHQQHQQQHFMQNNKSNSMPNISNRNVNNLEINRIATTVEWQTSDEMNANLISDTSSEFVKNLIPNQIDAEFSEYFPFFDFIVTKLALSHNLTVNYNKLNSSKYVTAAPNGTVSPTLDDTFDFCVLELHLNNQATSMNENDDADSVSRNNTTNSIPLNRTHIAATFVWRPVLILRQNELHQNIFVTHPLLPYRYPSWFFENTHKFWTCGLLCWILAGIVILLLVCILVASITFGLAIRNYLLKKRLSKGPNKIVLSAADFVFPIDVRRVDEGIEAMLCCWLQQLQEFGGPEVDKPDLLKGSIGSLKNLGLVNNASSATSTTTSTAPAVATTTTTNMKANVSTSGNIIKHNPCLDKRARYNGDLVQLKEMPTGASNELKAKAMDHLVMAHGLRHENINPLIGWLADPMRNAIVFEYCSRGSLQDVLIMDEIKLDWSFRLSLLTDLVRAMRYLHSSALRVHGALTSRNCVVDARWVLKVTDYGLNQFYEAQGVQPPTKSAKQLLWTSPELLRNPKSNNKFGTQAGDVYSFGIIMQEVVVRGEPYCMLSLSAEEIISKLKKPPPLIRPSVSKQAAPPEAINIMRQCWAETPDMRPDFNSVYERFKVLNHGRKVNFVDTMFQMLEKYSNNLEELIRERTEQLDIERKKTEQLLNRMLPSSVAEKLKLGLNVEPEEYLDVTIYFSDIVGFTTIAAYCSPVQVVDLLNDLYTCFDATINAYSVYKIETIGDAYMVVSGLPVRIPDHAEQIATMALDLLHQSGRFKIKHLPDVPLQLRIGLHTGPCCAGVVGLTMPRYCLFGDTVNTASRMESTGSSSRIHLSEATRDRLEKAGGYNIEPRGGIDIKGKGIMNTYWLLGKKGFDKVLPTPPPIGESHGLDEMLIQHCIRSKQRTKTPCISTTHSSSQSSSLAGEQVDVKVEITPPRDAESVQVPNSYSIESAPSVNLGLSLSDFKSTSPQPRKLSELPSDTLLATTNFGRLTPSPSSASSCKLYKKFEDFLDLSSPYNHYRCLSPSESNLTQCNDGKYIYGVSKMDNKPGSSRLLRRQFSLDKDDCQNSSGSGPSQITFAQMKSSLDVPLQDISIRPSSSPTNVKPARLHKQNSASVAQDLGKIEEIPASPTSCILNYRSTHLSQIPGSAAGSPRKPNEQNANQISTVATLEIPTTILSSDIASRAVSPISAATICSNSGDSISEHSNNNNGNICYHI